MGGSCQEGFLQARVGLRDGGWWWWGVSEAEWREEGRQVGLDMRKDPLSVRGQEAGGGILVIHSEAEGRQGLG